MGKRRRTHPIEVLYNLYLSSWMESVIKLQDIIYQIACNDMTVDEDLAIKLEGVTKRSKGMWLKLQKKYDKLGGS